MGAVLYFDKIKNVNVNLLISVHRLTRTTQNDYVQDLHYISRFVTQQNQNWKLYCGKKCSKYSNIAAAVLVG